MRLLLHACCAPCGGQVINELKKEGHTVSVYFYNPNIYPKDEYDLRLKEVRRYCEKLGVELIDASASSVPSEGKYEHEQWLDSVKGYENEPERGARCEICFQKRLGEVARRAKEDGFDGFASTLTISPHKPAEMVNKIGHVLAEKNKIKFIDNIWRKNEGFKKSCKISKEEHFHRQDYCGCEFSV